MSEWISAAEAARQLGVKQATLYSYVSRGVLTRRRGHGGRSSLFDPGEVADLARRGRPRRPAGFTGLVIESGLTEIADDVLCFRGVDALDLARNWDFEDACRLLWAGQLPGGALPGGALPGGALPGGPLPGGALAGGALPGGALSGGQFPGGRAGDGPPETWQATGAAVAAGTAAQAALPAGTFPLERLQVIVPALAAADPLRLQLDPPVVMAAGRAIIAGMVDCLPVASPPGGSRAAAGLATGPPCTGLSGAGLSGARPPDIGPPDTGPPDTGPPDTGPPDQTAGIAARLWPKLGRVPPSPGLLAALRAALVLLADHELAASTLAARVAASVRADPYAVVATGLGAVGGALHGGASLGAETMLAAADDPGDAPRVVGDLLRRGERVPGFGHFVYRAGDPRATLLLGMIRTAVPASPRLAVADAVLAETHRRALPAPNIDFALAVLASCAGMITGAGEAVFAVARTAGWLAHALEEYASRTPLRPRAVYTGPTLVR
jgi:citrate synthase